MEIIYIRDFDCDYEINTDIMINIERHCHLTDSDEIAVYKGGRFYYLNCLSDFITYPKVVYAEQIFLYDGVSISKVLPDIRKIGLLGNNNNDIQDFGSIEEIHEFNIMSCFIDATERAKHNIQTICEPLGNNMYRFTSPKGTWNIKVNKYK